MEFSEMREGKPDWGRMTVGELRAAYERGYPQAGDELDRRGIEPPVVEAGPAPVEVASLDAARERAPNPPWLREFAGSLKFEAAMLKSQNDALIAGVVGARGHEVRRAMRRAVLASVVVTWLEATAKTLVELADAMEAGGCWHCDGSGVRCCEFGADR